MSCHPEDRSKPFNVLFIQYAMYTLPSQEAVVAEWLRRLTRNQIPSGSVGSNPTDCEAFLPFFLFNHRQGKCVMKKMVMKIIAS